jgi:dihydrofolate synthase/folylpolyglutamate synthase
MMPQSVRPYGRAQQRYGGDQPVMDRSLADWLRWQESLNPHEIELGLERIKRVAGRLPVNVPKGSVFTVAGTNGKGTTVAFLECLLGENNLRVGVYTSPHLLRYNERIRVDGVDATDLQLTEAFATIEAARGDVPLTFFEFGTLAALLIFSQAACDAWVLEVGLGGRLDAVNMIDPDYSIITTVALDHQEWLGTTIEQIAAEKAGILRAHRPGFYADTDLPDAVVSYAAKVGADLHCLGREFAFSKAASSWSWRGREVELERLELPQVADAEQLACVSVALAAAEAHDPDLVDAALVNAALAGPRPAGRFQVAGHEPQWVLDVAHNPQAAGVLARRLDDLGSLGFTTGVIGMLADKDAGLFIKALAKHVDHWIVVEIDDSRAADARSLADSIDRITGQAATTLPGPEAAFAYVADMQPRPARVLCCGSFHVVGPALQWLGLI